MCSSGLGTGLSLNPLLAWLWSLLRLSDGGSTLWLRVGLKRLNRRNGSASEPEMILDRREEVLRPPPCQSSTLVCTRKLSIRYLASLRWNLVRSQASPWRASFNSSSITTLSWNLQHDQLQLVSIQGNLLQFYMNVLLTFKVAFTARTLNSLLVNRNRESFRAAFSLLILLHDILGEWNFSTKKVERTILQNIIRQPCNLERKKEDLSVKTILFFQFLKFYLKI